MSRRVTNRTLMTLTTHTGTGAYTTVGAQTETGYASFFNALGPGSHNVWYVCTDNNDWEVGRGIYDTTANTITRDVILGSSFGPGTPVNWPAGNQAIFIDIPAAFFDYLAVDFHISQLEPHTIATNVIGMAFGVDNTVSGQHAVALGESVTASGRNTLALGNETRASAMWSVSMGNQGKSDYVGALAIATGMRTTEGDTQGGILSPHARTSDATETDLLLNFNLWQPDSDRVVVINGNVAAYQYGGTGGAIGDSHGWAIRGAFKGTTPVSAITIDDLGGNAGTSAWSVQASSIGNSLISVTGEANKDINWSGTFLYSEAA